MSETGTSDAAIAAWDRREIAGAINLSRQKSLVLACFFALRGRRMDLLHDEYQEILALPDGLIRGCALAVLALGRGDLARADAAVVYALRQHRSEMTGFSRADLALLPLTSTERLRVMVETLIEVGLAAIASSSWSIAIFCGEHAEQLLSVTTDGPGDTTASSRFEAGWIVRARFDVLGLMGVSEFHTSSSTARFDELLRALAPVRRDNLLTGDHGLALICLGAIEHLRGGYAQAALDLARGSRLVGADQPGLIAHAQIELAFVRIRQGRWDDAERAVRNTIAYTDANDRSWLEPQILAIQALLSVLRGELDMGTSLGEHSQALSAAIPTQLGSMLLLHVHIATAIARNDWAGLQQVLEDSAEPGYRHPYRPAEWNALHLLASWHLRHLVAFRRRLAEWGQHPESTIDPYFWAFTAIDQENSRRFGDAAAAADQALRLITPEQDPLGRVWVRMVAGTVTARYGDSGSPDPIPALAIYEEASKELAALNAARYLAICEAIMRKTTLELQSMRTAQPSDLLTAQQQRIAQAVVNGYTSEEIASTFRISRKTVDFHVANILRRLNISSRREIVRALRTSSGPDADPAITGPGTRH